MRLRRLRIEHLRRFREPLVLEGFADGLNLFAAPNEAGKSTIAEAIRAAFFERHRSGSVEHLRPWDEPSATPTVELVFEIDGRRHQLTKAFLGRRRCELLIEGQAPLDGAAAEDHLARLLGFRFPGKGASSAEHRGIPGLLWIRQGGAHDLAEPVAHARDHLREVLGESLGDLASSGGDALLRAVEAARHELLTPAGGQPRGELAAALQRRSELATRCAELDREIADYRERVDRLATLRREQQREAEARPWAALREQHRAALARLDGAQGLESRLQAERAALAQWHAQAAALRSELETLARDDAALAAREQALARGRTADEAARAELQAWERRQAEAAVADTRARQQLEHVRAVAARADLQRNADELDATLGGLADTLARARAERERGARLQAEAEALAIAPAELKRLQGLADALREAQVRLEATATTLEFDLADGQTLRLGGETVTGRLRRTLLGPTELQLGSLGRITVHPGGADIASLGARRDALAAELASGLQRLHCATLAEAEERARQAAQRLQDARSSRTVLDALAPQGVEALEADREARIARASALRAALAALPPVGHGDTPLPDLAGAQAQATRCAEALAAADAELSRARVAAGLAAGALASARQEQAAAQATATDPLRAQRIATARQTLVDATAREAAAQQSVEATAAELARVNLALLRQDVDRLGRSAQQMEAAHEQRRQDITRLEVTLETQGALGLEEQRAEIARDQEAASRRAEELSRRAAALDHLLGLLREQRAAMARRLRAPLQKHLDHHLGILFPGAHIDVADDLSPGAITRTGPRGPERGGFDDLSMGTREQMGIVARLAYADLLREAGRPTLLILDDALVHTDEDRLGQMKRVLYDAAQRHQVLIFTCHPAAWRDLGVVARGIG